MELALIKQATAWLLMVCGFGLLLLIGGAIAALIERVRK